jgi:hypothetical protein
MTTKDKKDLLKIIKEIDVKKIDVETTDTKLQKWYRFGMYYALRVVCEIIDQLPTKDESTIS